MPNRLSREQSPYLLQHQHNPVDWYPWGDEAFERARREDKPIFLSIGYLTCHWCHVMAHESFERADIADVLNRHFVPVKVDREERPNVDRVYMTFVQATTGSGGWPLSVWLTPALEPFYGGTYFPPAPQWGRPGFVQVLEEIARLWRADREKVVGSAASVVEQLRGLQPDGGGGALPGTEQLARAVREFASAFDHERGGFGDAPKFPRPSELLFLLREHARTGDEAPRDMVVRTLRAMALGGLRDHIGGGFHRYTVDGAWRVPHFEKMLYDQAQLVLAFVEAAQLTGDRFFADVALDTLAYVRRDLTDPAGGFYSAEDADSIPPEAADPAGAHPMEGAFYLWRDEEIAEVLDPDDAAVFRMRYGIRPEGNAPFDPHGEFTGKNLLYTAQPVESIARTTGRTVEDVESRLAQARAALLARRATRPRPHLDDKVLTAWNGLMIAALARAARVLEPDGPSLDAARRAAAFLRTHLRDQSRGTLLRRYRQGDAGVEAYAEDYAYLIFGLLELFQADGDPDWLDWALALQREQDARFGDPEGGGWFSTTGQDPSVLLRLKDDYDGAEPAASSVGVLNLLVLSHLTPDGDAGAREAAIARTLAFFAPRIERSGRVVPMLLAALSVREAGLAQIAVAGDPASNVTRALMDEVRRHYLPAAIVVPVTPAHHAALAERLPWTAGMRPGGAPTAFVCRDFVCAAPATSAEALAEQLRALTAAGGQ